MSPSAYRDIGRFEYRGEGSFYAWLKTIAQHRLQDAIRSDGRGKRGGPRRQIEGVRDAAGGSAVELGPSTPWFTDSAGFYDVPGAASAINPTLDDQTGPLQYWIGLDCRPAWVRIKAGPIREERPIRMMLNSMTSALCDLAGAPLLQPGDGDQDCDFHQLDLVRVQVAAKYLSGEAATWGDGDWDGARGGQPGNPPAGSGLFDQVDIIAALTGPYAALAQSTAPGLGVGDNQTTIVCDSNTGELAVDATAGTNVASINIVSRAGIFTGNPAQSLGGSFSSPNAARPCPESSSQGIVSARVACSSGRC